MLQKILILIIFLIPLPLPVRQAGVFGTDKIAFVSEQTGNKEIYSMNTDGSEVKRITSSGDENFSPRWSPDGTRIAYLNRKNSAQNNINKISLNLIRENGTDKTKLIEAALIYNLKWVSGSRLSSIAIEDIYEKDVKTPNWIPELSTVFKKSESGICLINPDIANQKIIFKTPAPLKDALKSRAWTSKFDISPDENKTVFTAVVNWSDEEIYVMDNETNNARRLTRVVYEFGNVDPIWTQDGKRIIFRRTWKPGADLLIMDEDGSNVERLAKGDIKEFVLSPDGKKIAYIDFALETNTLDKSALKVLNLNTGRIKTLTNFVGMDSAPSWASNNEEIAFVRGAGNEAEIYAISVDQKTLTRLTNNKYYDGEPGWKP